MNVLQQKWEPLFKSIQGLEARATFTRTRANHLRFANSVITQNTCMDDQTLQLIMACPGADGYRVQQSSSAENNLELLWSNLLSQMDEAPLNKEFKGLIYQPQATPVPTWFAATSGISLEDKARMIRNIVEAAPDLLVGGIFVTETSEQFIRDTAGQPREEKSSEWMIDVRYRNKAGHCASFRTMGRDLSRFDPDAMAAEARDRCHRNLPGATPVAGSYPVLFAPDAVSELMYFLSHCGLGGREYDQGRGPFTGKIGETVIPGRKITLTDNPFHPDTLTENNDHEGIPKRILPLIQEGVLCNVAHSLQSAASIEQSTGHAGGYPMLMELTGGSEPHTALGNREGTIIISRFHYPTIDDPNRIVLKGKTKDGTFHVKQGEQIPIPDLEFHLEIPRLLAMTASLSNDRRTIPQGSLASCMPGANIVPWLLTEPLDFSDNKLVC